MSLPICPVWWGLLLTASLQPPALNLLCPPLPDSSYQAERWALPSPTLSAPVCCAKLHVLSSMREGETYQPAVLKSYVGPLLLFSSVLVLNPDSYLLLYALSLSIFLKIYLQQNNLKTCGCIWKLHFVPLQPPKVFQDPWKRLEV